MAGKKIRPKRKKNPSKRKKPQASLANVGGQDEENDENTNITTVKSGLRNVLKPKFRNVIMAAITEKSIEATKLCATASLLFLYQVQTAYDTKHIDFFRQIGENVIRDCFLGVIPKNFRTRNIPYEFWEIAENEIDWPNTNHFGNGIKDLIDTYTTNVKTNLLTHGKKRLREYLRMKIYQRNQMTPAVIRYYESDIDHTIAWAIFGTESIKEDDPDRVSARMRRGMLLKMIVDNSWFDVRYNSIAKFTKEHWFKSIPFWLSLQRQLDEFNTTEAYREQRRLEREHFRFNKCYRNNSNGHCKCGLTKKGPPRVRNLAVIPICGFTRAHYTLDNYTFYNLLCSAKIVPQTQGKSSQRNITFKEFMQHKEYYWRQYFRMRKINWFVRYKKKFRFRILSNGQAVSLTYDVEKKEAALIDKQKNKVINRYKNGEIPYESGTDPGVNTWQATTLRDVNTGKEVS